MIAVALGLTIASADLYLKSYVLSVIHNSGSFLGIAIPNSLVLILHVLILGIGGWVIFYKIKQEFWQLWAIVVLLSSLSNLIDRVRLGAVADYIYLLGIWFNLADLTVTLALLVAIYAIIRNKYV
jgi:lipoprotein signal peptidase